MYDRDKNKLVIFSNILRPFISLNKEKSVFFKNCTEFNDDDTRNTDTMTQQKETPVEQIDIEHKETQHAQATFSPGSIHSEEVREFWKKELNANEWVMLTLKEGYVIPFKEFPPKYEEPNNASAIREMTFTYETVLELKNSEVVKFTNEKPHCVSPLTVSYKTGRDGSIKKRLCLDGSRCINKCIKEQKVTLSHFQRALELTREKDYQVTYDLKSAYHHIKIHPTQTKYLGAAVTKPEGDLQYFVFLYLPFGGFFG